MSATAQMKCVALKEYVDEGKVEPHHFEVNMLPALDEAPAGGVLLQVLALSVDPYMRGRMRSSSNYVMPSFQLGQPIVSGGVSRVLQSNVAGLEVGQLVESRTTLWQERMALPADAAAALWRNHNPHDFPAHYFLGAMGMPGFSAWNSLKQIVQPKAGETAFVTAAAGAVGTVVGQLLKHVYGCRVVGSAGSDEKVAYLVDELGFDAAFNYKTTSAKDGLATHCPDGINIYFDSVGGETLEAALNSCVRFARIVACGAISTYDAMPGTGYGVKNLFNIVTKEIRMQGFMAMTGMTQPDLRAAFLEEMGELVSSGKVKVVETVTVGLENVGQAFSDMMAGRSTGKALVVLGEQ